MGRQADFSVIDGNTALCGVIGYPIGHSLSPVMHNAAFHALGMNWRYLPFEVAPENVESAVRNFPSLGIRGINVTIPHKEAVIPFMDELTDGAKAVGSVNTIEVASGRLKGYNTDAIGFAGTIEPYKGYIRRAALIGAGGAARAVLFALLSGLELEHVMLLNRTADLDQARRMEADITGHVAGSGTVIERDDIKSGSARAVIEKADLLVNCTPLGMPPLDDLCPIPAADWIHSDTIVYDLVYNPARTRLLEMAGSRRARAINGVDMLVGQGAAAFTIWTGREAPREVMKKALLAALEARSK